jgi:hypothetical protein
MFADTGDYGDVNFGIACVPKRIKTARPWGDIALRVSGIGERGNVAGKRNTCIGKQHE